MKSKLVVKEASVKKAIVDYLTLQERLGKCYYVRNNSFAGSLLDGKGRKHYVQQGKRGSPDILLCMSFPFDTDFKFGRFIGIECKSSIGKLSPNQIETKQKIEALGGLYIEARGIKDIEFLFK